MMTSFIVKKASDFAREKHKNQQRKYTNEPYFNHCEEVAKLVSVVTIDQEMIAAAYLHDVVEDCEVSLSEIKHEFGGNIAQMVSELTDVSTPADGNRENRKEIDRLHTAKASPRAKTIKLADLISNTKSIKERDQEFAKVYLEEKRRLLRVLTEGNPSLFVMAFKCAYD
jgi:(p)ppGpp synthase/HD superfamily hydrolase